MATSNDIIRFAEGLADQGVGVDADNSWGTQCVDLPNSISINFFGKAFGAMRLICLILPVI